MSFLVCAFVGRTAGQLTYGSRMKYCDTIFINRYCNFGGVRRCCGVNEAFSSLLLFSSLRHLLWMLDDAQKYTHAFDCLLIRAHDSFYQYTFCAVLMHSNAPSHRSLYYIWFAVWVTRTKISIFTVKYIHWLHLPQETYVPPPLI